MRNENFFGASADNYGKDPIETTGGWLITMDDPYRLSKGMWLPVITYSDNPEKHEKYLEFRSDLAAFIKKWWPDYLKQSLRPIYSYWYPPIQDA
ncbi:MAG: hypothetical protein HDQ89_11270 [Desulfovibrio sp.]|nr:hypothetical protein [Desulfovibrio sp.]